jgi:hypothetical protein
MASRHERFVGVFEFSVRVMRQPDHPVKVSLADFRTLHKALLAARAANKRLSKEIEENRLIIVG